MPDHNIRYSMNEFVGDGVTVERNISFAGGYLLTSHVKSYYVTEGGTEVTVPITFVSATRISTSPIAVPNGLRHVIYRSTPFDAPLADFTDGAVVTEANLDANARQAIFVAAELSDEFRESVDRAGVAAESAEQSADIALNTLAQSAANVVIAAGYAAATADDRAQTTADVVEAHAVADTFNGIVTTGSATLNGIVTSGSTSLNGIITGGTSSLNTLVANGTADIEDILFTGSNSLNSIISAGTNSLTTLISNGTTSLNGIVNPGTTNLTAIVTNGTTSLTALVTNGSSTLNSLASTGVSNINSAKSDAIAAISADVATTAANRVQTGLDRTAAAADADRAEAAAAYKTAIARKTYAELATITGAANQTAAVFDDSGSHTDPVVGGTVSNSGLYRYSTSPAGWEWLATLGGTVVVWADIANKPASFTPSAHTHAAEDITSGTLGVARVPALDAAKVTTGTFAVARIPDLPATKVVSGSFDPARIPALAASKIITGTFDAARIPAQPWSSITGKPTLGTASAQDVGYFAPNSHTHAKADISGLQSDLDGKAAASHTHSTTNITGLDAALAAKASLTGAETLESKTLKNPTEVVDTKVSGTALTINLANGSMFAIDTTGNPTITLPTPEKGKSFVVRVKYGGAHVPVWAGGTRIWADSTAPTPTSVSGKIDEFVFDCYDVTEGWIGSAGRQNIG